MAVVEADVRDYVWLATRPQGGSWAVGKLNSRSWRRRIVAAQLVGATKPTRRKKMVASPNKRGVLPERGRWRDVYVLEVDARFELTGEHFREHGVFFAGREASFALEIAVRVPCLVLDRSGITGLVLGSSREELAQRSSQRLNSSPTKKPVIATNFEEDGTDWCEVLQGDSNATSRLARLVKPCGQDCLLLGSSSENLEWVELPFLPTPVLAEYDEVLMLRRGAFSESSSSIRFRSHRPARLLVAYLKVVKPSWLDVEVHGDLRWSLVARDLDSQDLCRFSAHERLVRAGETVQLGSSDSEAFAVFVIGLAEEQDRDSIASSSSSDAGYDSAIGGSEDEQDDDGSTSTARRRRQLASEESSDEEDAFFECVEGENEPWDDDDEEEAPPPPCSSDELTPPPAAAKNYFTSPSHWSSSSSSSSVLSEKVWLLGDSDSLAVGCDAEVHSMTLANRGFVLKCGSMVAALVLCVSRGESPGCRVATILPRYVVCNLSHELLEVLDAKGDLLLALPAGARAALHWLSTGSSELLRLRQGGRSSRGLLRLLDLSSESVALTSKEEDVALLRDAHVLRLESRPRQGDSDDFGTLLLVGEEQEDSRVPLVACSNETDLLVVCWQQSEDSTQLWLVSPRSRQPFGWCRQGSRRVRCLALTNRSEAEAFAIVKLHLSRLEKAAATLSLDVVGSRSTLPLLDASADDPRRVEVVREHWGVDALVDARRGGALLRFAWHERQPYEESQLLGSASSSETSLRFADVSISFISEEENNKEARRESLALSLERIELVLAQQEDKKHHRTAATCDLTIGELSVVSHSRGAHLTEMLQRDSSSGASEEEEDFFSLSLARQVDGAAEVWRYAGAALAPLALSLDRPTLHSLSAIIETALTVPQRHLREEEEEGHKIFENKKQETTTTFNAERLAEMAGFPAGSIAASCCKHGASDETDLFAALCREPRVFVDTIELAAFDLRLTLALAGSSGENLKRSFIVEESYATNLLELVSPLASLSDASFSIGRFSARHALLTVAQLRTALLGHARKEALRHAFLGGNNHKEQVFKQSHLVKTGFAVANLPTDLVGTATSAIGDRLAGAHALLSGDAAYFCERAKRHRQRRIADRIRLTSAERSWGGRLGDGFRLAREDVANGFRGALHSALVDVPRSTRSRDTMGALLGVLVKPVVGLADALADIARSAAAPPPRAREDAAAAAETKSRARRQGVHHHHRSSQQLVCKGGRRRRALSALPDGGGFRRRLAPYSRLGAAAQLVASKLAFLEAAPLKKQETATAPSNRDDEVYVDHAALLDGGFVALTTRGLVVLNSVHRQPWTAPWTSLQATQDGDDALVFFTGSTSVRAVCSSPKVARCLRSRLRLLGFVTLQEDHHPRHPHTTPTRRIRESPLRENSRRKAGSPLFCHHREEDKLLPIEDAEEDEDEEDNADHPLLPWVEEAVAAVASEARWENASCGAPGPNCHYYCCLSSSSPRPVQGGGGGGGGGERAPII